MINKQQIKFASGVNTDFSKKYTALINKLQNEVKVWKFEINSLFFLSSVFISLFENLDVALLRKELLDLFNESTVVYYLVNKYISMDNIIELIISYGISNIWVNGLIKTNLNRNKNDNTVNFWDNLSVLFIFKADKIINGIINTLKRKIVLTSTVDQMVFNKLDDFILNIVSIISENGYVDNSLLNSSDIFWEYLMKVANFIAKLNNPVFSNMFYNSLSNIEKEFRVNIAERMVYHKTSRKSGAKIIEKRQNLNSVRRNLKVLTNKVLSTQIVDKINAIITINNGLLAEELLDIINDIKKVYVKDQNTVVKYISSSDITLRGKFPLIPTRPAERKGWENTNTNINTNTNTNTQI
uniref:Uncharacterized protein n=1 Tax=Wolfiporia cocos TaxID=81056 RepID=A0A7G7YDR2_9APHY|nr:hypothetical protein [Wolfiporia cocos]QNH92632.1 hypothetical protein [Wolfiporia cocos]